MSPGTDTIIQNAVDGRNMARCSRLCRSCALWPQPAREITQEIEWFSCLAVPPCSRRTGLDGLYVIINGSLGIYVPRAGAGHNLLDKSPAARRSEAEAIFRQHTSGDRGGSARQRSGTPSNSDFREARSSNPLAMREIAKVLVQRLQASPPATAIEGHAEDIRDRASWGERRRGGVRPATPGVPEGQRRAELVSYTTGGDRTSHWFHGSKGRMTFVVYVTGFRATTEQTVPAPGGFRGAPRKQRRARATVARFCSPTPNNPSNSRYSSSSCCTGTAGPSSPTRQWMDLAWLPPPSCQISRGCRAFRPPAHGRAVGLVLSGAVRAGSLTSE